MARAGHTGSIEPASSDAEGHSGHTTITTTDAVSTTRTTTIATAPTGRIALTVLADGIMVSRAAPGLGIPDLVEALIECMIEHIHRARAPRQGHLKLAQVMPHHASDPWNEVVLLWCPMDFTVQVLLDLRAIRGGVRQVEAGVDQETVELVAVYVRQAGVYIWVNGIPSHAYIGQMQDADVITVAWDGSVTPVLPRSVVFRAWPFLALFALDIVTPAPYDPPRELMLMIPHLRREMTDALEVRAIRLGFWLSPKRLAIVYNRMRGELAIYVKGRLPVSSAQVTEALAMIEEWADVHDLRDTFEMSFETALFIGRDSFERRSNFQLVSTPSFPQAHLLWQVNEQTHALAHLFPAPQHLVVQAREGPTHGHVLTFRRQTGSDGYHEGTSYVQLSLSSEAGRSRTRPCDALRLAASPAI